MRCWYCCFCCWLPVVFLMTWLHFLFSHTTSHMSSVKGGKTYNRILKIPYLYSQFLSPCAVEQAKNGVTANAEFKSQERKNPRTERKIERWKFFCFPNMSWKVKINLFGSQRQEAGEWGRVQNVPTGRKKEARRWWCCRKCRVLS